MPPPVDRALLDQTVDLVQRAGRLTLKWFRSASLSIDAKGDGTPVTEADRAAERFLREQLEKLHPGDAIRGEEEADVEGTTGRTWIIDPIDGTKAFTHGVPLYSNLLALHDEEGPAIGIINLPALGETVYAGRGLGCFDNGAPVQVNTVDTMSGSYLMTSGMDQWAPERMQRLKDAGIHIRTWADGYGYALVATGRAEAMVDLVAEHYDLAPMPVILAESGGRFTNLDGVNAHDLGDGVATNGHVHDELLALLAE